MSSRTYVGPSPTSTATAAASQRPSPARIVSWAWSAGLSSWPTAPARRFLVSNPLVWRLHRSRLSGLNVAERILLPDGERYKQLPAVARVYDALIRAHADRATTLITFGGGVLGDMAGFAAATYLRGIALVHVPTTLLAQGDSAIGGKVGVNHPLGKNPIGAFYQPNAGAIDPRVPATLPRRQFRARLTRVIKY